MTQQNIACKGVTSQNLHVQKQSTRTYGKKHQLLNEVSIHTAGRVTFHYV